MKPADAQRLVDRIKLEYPNPVIPLSPEAVGQNKYCVGGAFCRYLSDTGHYFPTKPILAQELRDVNSALAGPSFFECDNDAADQFAESIIYWNDSGIFERAWMVLYDALKFGSAT